MSRKGLLPQADADHKSGAKLDSGPIQEKLHKPLLFINLKSFQLEMACYLLWSTCIASY